MKSYAILLSLTLLSFENAILSMDESSVSHTELPATDDPLLSEADVIAAAQEAARKSADDTLNRYDLTLKAIKQSIVDATSNKAEQERALQTLAITHAAAQKKLQEAVKQNIDSLKKQIQDAETTHKTALSELNELHKQDTDKQQEAVKELVRRISNLESTYDRTRGEYERIKTRLAKTVYDFTVVDAEDDEAADAEPATPTGGGKKRGAITAGRRTSHSQAAGESSPERVTQRGNPDEGVLQNVPSEVRSIAAGVISLGSTAATGVRNVAEWFSHS